jgi:hypothetical protein
MVSVRTPVWMQERVRVWVPVRTWLWVPPQAQVLAAC